MHVTHHAGRILTNTRDRQGGRAGRQGQLSHAESQVGLHKNKVARVRACNSIKI